jgi:hypothetical protein
MYAKILLMTALLLTGQVYAQTSTTTTDTTVVKKKKKKKKPAEDTITTTTTTTTATATTTAIPTLEAKREETKVVPATVLTPAQEFIKYMKEHFSASYHGEYYFVRRDIDSLNSDDHDLKDFKVMHNPTVIYKPTPNWQVLATAEFKYTDQHDVSGATYPNTFYRALFTLTRKNILVEKDHGVTLDAGVGRRQFNNATFLDDKHMPVYSLGNERVFATVSKTYGKHSGSLFVQYLYNEPRQSKPTTFKHAVEIIPTLTLQLTSKLSYLFVDDFVLNTSKGQTYHDLSSSHDMTFGYLNYQWTDKVGTYLQLKYEHAESFNASRGADDGYEYYIGSSYAFTPKFTLTAEMGSDFAHSSDGRSFFSKKAHYPEFALYVDAAL